MAFVKTLMVFMMLVSVPVMCAKPSSVIQQREETAGPHENDLADQIEDALRKVLQPFDGLHIPALPILNVKKEDYVSIALSLSDLQLTGISNVNVTDANIVRRTVNIIMPKITLDVGHYSSGGHIINLPFSGEGPMKIALHKLQINLKIGFSNSRCAKLLSTTFDLDLPRLEVEFTNMNPGSDQGQLINIAVSSFGPDIIDYLEILLNGGFNSVADEIIVDAINSALCPGWVSDSPLNDDRIYTFLNDILQHYLEVLTGSNNEN